MSISRPNQGVTYSPAKKVYTIKSGSVHCYDRLTKESYQVKNISGIVLESDVIRLDGFSSKRQQYLKSNYFRNGYRGQITIKDSNGLSVHTGSYVSDADVDLFKSFYDKSPRVRILYFYMATKSNPKGGEVIELQLKGSGISAFLEGKEDKRNVDGCSISLKGFEDKSKGSVSWKQPIFEFKELDKSIDFVNEMWNKAAELDTELQKWIDSLDETIPRRTNPTQTYQESEITEDEYESEEEVEGTQDDLPF